MAIRPNHVAAVFYILLALFLSASWVLMSYPIGHPFDLSLSFTRFAFSPENDHRTWFIWFAIATLSAPVLAALFLWERAATRAVAAPLAVAAGAYLGLALWQFDSSIIFNAGVAFACATYGWWRAA